MDGADRYMPFFQRVENPARTIEVAALAGLGITGPPDLATAFGTVRNRIWHKAHILHTLLRFSF